MKLGTFSRADRTFVGVVVEGGDRIFDPAAACRADGLQDHPCRTMLDLIDAGPEALDRLRDLVERRAGEPEFLHPLTSVAVLAPVPVPRQLREAALYPGHIRHAPIGMRRLQAGKEGRELTPDEAAPLPDVPGVFRDRPVFYFQNRFNVVGHEADIAWPAWSEVMDFELEFGVFLSRGGRNLSAKDAAGCIFGYTLYNDLAARDVQLREGEAGFGPSKSKSFDGANAMGPWIVTPDELPAPYDLEMGVRVNGEVWAQGRSGGMLHSFEELIAFYSRDETLHAGEFLASGTAAGGTGLEIGRFPRHGDRVELVAEGIGVLANRLLRPSSEPVL